MAMRVGMVTTWGSRCGVATYSEQLCNALREYGILPVPLVPQGESRPRYVEGFTPTEAWHKNDTAGLNVTRLQQAVADLRLDAVHFQHEFGLHRDGRVFLRAVRALSQTIPVFVTLHTVPLSTHFAGRYGWLAMLRRHARAIICHTVDGCASVAAVLGAGDIVHIQHGTPKVVQGSAERGRALLGLDRVPSSIGVSVGFIGSGKNVACTALGFGECLARSIIPRDACFFICGDPTGDETYLIRRLQPIVDSVGGVNLHILGRFLDDGELADIFAAADYAVLNTQSDNLSASGQVHQLAAHGVPAAVAARPIYNDGIVAGAIPFHVYDRIGGRSPEDPSPSLIAAIGALATDPVLTAHISRYMQAYAERTRWTGIAAQHADLYKGA